MKPRPSLFIIANEEVNVLRLFLSLNIKYNKTLRQNTESIN
jgi:hypothetical protein